MEFKYKEEIEQLKREAFDDGWAKGIIFGIVITLIATFCAILVTHIT